MRSIFILFFAASALAGTLIGHPVTTGFAAGTSLVYTAGALPVGTIVVDHCDGTFESVTVNATIDPVQHDQLGLPEGDLCGLSIGISADVTLSGYTPANSNTFALELSDVGTIEVVVDPPVYVPEEGEPGGPTALRLAAPNWITATSLGLGSGNVTVDGSHPLHDDLVDALRNDSVLW